MIAAQKLTLVGTRGLGFFVDRPLRQANARQAAVDYAAGVVGGDERRREFAEQLYGAYRLFYSVRLALLAGESMDWLAEEFSRRGYRAADRILKRNVRGAPPNLHVIAFLVYFREILVRLNPTKFSPLSLGWNVYGVSGDREVTTFEALAIHCLTQFGEKISKPWSRTVTAKAKQLYESRQGNLARRRRRL